MITVGIIGATGYAGEELIEILLRHPQVRITYLGAKIDQPQGIAQIFPRFKGRIDLICQEPDIKEIIAKCQLVFLALPHTVSKEIVPKLLGDGKRVIDLSADYRLKDSKVYTQFYKTKHTDSENLKIAVYGLPEIYRVKIKEAGLIANPGCYPTAAILGLAPLLALDSVDLESIIIDAKSGFSGAGRKVAEDFFLSQRNTDFKAYKVNVHQHAPEMNQELSKLAGKKLQVTFVPHLLPVERGILETIYVRKSHKSAARQISARAGSRHRIRCTWREQVTSYKLIDLYKKFYQREPFVRIKEAESWPQLKDVVKTNYCDIALADFGNTIIIISAIDNLLKGASGQAVQNMNLMCGYPETTALV